MTLRAHSLFLSLVCITMAYADSPQKIPPKEECTPDRKPIRVAARHIESKGVGYNTGYTTVEGFFGHYMSNMTQLPFLDLRGHVFNDGKLAANAGLGFRSLLGCRIYGINAYYDYRDTHRSHYNQVSAGLETIGARWDFRLNGYLPVGSKMSHPYYTQFHDFSGNTLILSRKYEFAMKGADAEFGIHFCKSKNFELYAAAGPYYFIGPIPHPTWGGKARINAKWKDLIVAELSNTYDRVFHDNVQGQISLNWPLGPRPVVKKRSSHCYDHCKFIKSMADRFIQPVARDEIVVVDARRKTSVAIDPTTGQPFNFIFVDNTSHSAGTYESPYSSLATAEANSSIGDIIYVFPGDGTSNNMNMGITLQNNQSLLGSGIAQTIQTTAGTVTIPPLTTSMPVITNTAGDTVILANNNVISGMFIIHGVSGTTNGINQPTSGSNVVISNNTIAVGSADTTSTSGITLTNVTGNVQISNNSFNQGQINANTSINIDSASLENANYSIDRNQGANNIGLDIALTDCSNYNFSIANNNFNSVNQNLEITVNSTSATQNSFSIDNNYFLSGNAQSNVLIYEGASNNMVSFTNNQVSAPDNIGLSLRFQNTSQTNLSCSGNSMTARTNAIGINTSDSAELSISIDNNDLIGDFNSTIVIDAGSTGQFRASLTNNNLVNINGNSGLVANYTIGTTSTNISNNTFSGGSSGIQLNPAAGTTNSATIANNSFSNQSLDSIAINNSGTITAQIAGNNFFDAITQAVDVQNLSGGNICLGLINNTASPIQQGLGSGAYLLNNTGDVFTLDAERNIGLITSSGTTSGTCD